METHIAFVGFGEAAMAFAGAFSARGYDRKTDQADARPAKLADFAATGVDPCLTLAQVAAGATVLLSLVTADQALAAAEAVAPLIAPGVLYLDLNSVAPQTKRAAAAAIERVGGRYVDVAVMAPVHPLRRAVPLLVAGPHAADALAVLAELGFSDVRVQPGPVGAATSVKMIRSVMIKGIEALTAECLLAAEAAGLRDAVLASLGAEWAARADYNLDRMMVHGVRRAAEMEESAATLSGLGVDPVMTRGTVARQRAIGALGLAAPAGLGAKLAAITAASDLTRAEAA